MYVHIYIYVCVCVYIYTYTYTHIMHTYTHTYIQDPSSKYRPGARNDAGWLKLKPEDLAGGTDTFDCVIIGKVLNKYLSQLL